MNAAAHCVGCDRSVEVGTRRYASRVAYGDRYLCAECAELSRAVPDDTAGSNRVLQRIRDYGLGMAGGRNGAVGGPG